MLLGFKRRFEPFVLDGSKTHTIRTRRKIRPRVDEICHCYGDSRQKTMHLLGRWPFVRLEEIWIEPEGSASVAAWIDGTRLHPDELCALLWRDGFRDKTVEYAPMSAREFWADRLAQGPFAGDLIHWDFAQPVQEGPVFIPTPLVSSAAVVEKQTQ